MKILRKDTDLNILLNTETDFQTNLGWEENLKEFETEILSDIINPIENYETVRYIHKPYSSSGVTQTDIWFYFYFLNTGGIYVQDYYTGDDEKSITYTENEQMLKQSTQSFFRLEFFKTPGTVSGTTLTCEPPTRQNRKLIFAKNLSLPLGEKMFYNTLNGYIHLPVFKGSNYENKENMYFFWFQDESVLTETNLSGTTTGNTFFMTAKFYNAKDGTIKDFTNDCYGTGYTINEQNDMYYQVDINKRDYSYQVYFYNGVVKCEEVGLTNRPIMFFEKGGGTAPTNIVYHTCSNVTPTPTPTATRVSTPTPTPTPTHTPTPTNNQVSYFNGIVGYDPVLITEACSLVNTISMTGDTSSFCTSVIFTSNDILAPTLGTGNYYISYLGSYMQVSHTNGTNTFTKTLSGDCQLCPGMIYLSSGYTKANACTGTTQLYYYESNFGTNGTKIYTEPTLTDVAPGESGHIVYYYSYDYNTIYYINDGEGRKYNNPTDVCPTPTPTTGTVINAIISTVSGQDACDGGDPDLSQFYTLTIYGSNIVNASSIVSLPAEVLAYFSDNQQFWVKARSSGSFYWKKFILDGNISPNQTSTASGSATICL